MRLTSNSRSPAGPLLDKPSILLPDASLLSSFLFYFTVLLLGGAGAMGCFFTAFDISPDPGTVIAVGMFCAAVCTAQFLLPKGGWIVCLISSLVWAVTLWQNFDDMIQASARVVNVVSSAYSDKLNFRLPQLLTEFVFPDREAYLFTLFAALLQFPFFWFLSIMLVRHKTFLGSFCLTGIFLLLPLGFSIVPAEWAMALLLLFWLFLMISVPTLRQRRLLLENRGKLQAAGTGYLRASTLLLLPALFLCLALARAICPPETYRRPQLANDLREKAVSSLNLPALFRGGVGGGNTRVDLSALGQRQFSGKTVLEVRRQWIGGVPSAGETADEKKEYLKSFVGSVYTGTSWEQLEQEDKDSLARLLGRQKVQTMPADFSQLLGDLSVRYGENYKPKFPDSEDLTDLDAHFSYVLSVKSIDVSPRCVYSPYGLYSPGGAPQDTVFTDDGFLSARGLFGARSYDFSGISLPTDPALSSYRRRFLNGFYGALESGTYDEEQAMELKEICEESLEGVAETGEEADLWKAPEDLKSLLAPEARALAETAEQYNRFVYEKYTVLPGPLRKYLTTYLEDHLLTLERIPVTILGDGTVLELDPSDSLKIPGTATWVIPSDLPEGSDMKIYVSGAGPTVTSISISDVGRDTSSADLLIRNIQQLFREEFTYTLEPEPLPAGADFVEHFLTQKKGYCVHFATAAVTMLRAAGIPARYAEGYAVPLSEDGVWIDVPDENAHAWVEVWYGGLGWIPVEVTPPSPDAPAAYDTAAVPEGEVSPTPAPEATPAGDASPLPETSPSPEPEATPQATESPESSEPSREEPEPTQEPTAAPGTGPGTDFPQGGGVLPGGSSGLSILPTVLTALAGILIPLLILVGRRKWILSRRQRDIRRCREDPDAAADRNRGALRAYAHYLRLCRAGGIRPDRGGTLEELALKARFSSHLLTPQEYERFLAANEALERRLKETLPPLKKLKCQYLSVLF